MTRAGRILFATERAASWLKNGGGNTKPRLPKALARWVANEPRGLFYWKEDDRKIIVRAVGHNRKGSRCLILEENGGVLGSLTAEETTVLRWISYGKKDKEIAELEKMKLCRVKRCVKRIFDKLGVYTRAAAAAAYERLVMERGE